MKDQPLRDRKWERGLLVVKGAALERELVKLPYGGLQDVRPPSRIKTD